MRQDATPEMVAEANTKVLAVLKALGFTVKRDMNDDYGRRSSIWINAHKGDQSLFVRAFDYQNPERIEFAGGYPSPKVGKSNHYGIEHHSITVAWTKTPDQIVKDIERRLMPKYLAELDKVRKSNAQSDHYETEKRSTLAKLKGSKLDERELESDSIHLDHCGDVWGSAKTSGGDVTLEIHSLPVETALKVLKLIKTDCAALDVES